MTIDFRLKAEATSLHGEFRGFHLQAEERQFPNEFRSFRL